MTESCPGPGPRGLGGSWGRRPERGSRHRGLKRGALGGGGPNPLPCPHHWGCGPYQVETSPFGIKYQSLSWDHLQCPDDT